MLLINKNAHFIFFIASHSPFDPSTNLTPVSLFQFVGSYIIEASLAKRKELQWSWPKENKLQPQHKIYFAYNRNTTHGVSSRQKLSHYKATSFRWIETLWIHSHGAQQFYSWYNFPPKSILNKNDSLHKYLKACRR